MFYTIGSKAAYTKAIADSPDGTIKKLGITHSEEGKVDYPGGYVFKSYSDASTRILEVYLTTDFIVFGLATLPSLIYRQPANWWYNLKRDALILPLQNRLPRKLGELSDSELLALCEDFTYLEIGEIFGVTKQYVSVVLHKRNLVGQIKALRYSYRRQIEPLKEYLEKGFVPAEACRLSGFPVISWPHAKERFRLKSYKDLRPGCPNCKIKPYAKGWCSACYNHLHRLKREHKQFDVIPHNYVFLIKIIYDELTPDSYEKVVVSCGEYKKVFDYGDPIQDFLEALQFARYGNPDHVLFSSSCDLFVMDNKEYAWAKTEEGYRIVQVEGQ